MKLEPVSDLGDPRLADYRNVRDGELLRRRGAFVAEGRIVVRTLLARSRFGARSVLVNRASLEGLRDVLEPLGDESPVYLAEGAAIDSVLGFHHHQGALAIGERGPERPLALPPEGRSLVLVLEDLTDADNVGAVFRNALALGAGAVVLTPRCADPLYRKAIRVSMGAALLVPFARDPEWAATLREAGHRLVGLTPDPAAPALDRHGGLGPRVALVLGSEGPGLSRAALAAVDVAARIPMAPGADSLNVAVAAAIALWTLGVVG